MALPTKKFLASKCQDINNLINHQFTEAELQEKLRRSGVLQNKSNALERAALYNRRKDAESIGDNEAVAAIDAKLAVLEGPKLAFSTSLLKPALPVGPKTQQQRLAEINAANRRLNTINVRKAQLAERRAKIAHREAMARGEAEPDPFARVKTYAKTHHDVNATARKTSNSPNSSRDVSRAQTPLDSANGRGLITPTGTPQKPKSKAEDEAAAEREKMKAQYRHPDGREFTRMEVIEAIDWEIDMSLFDHLKDYKPTSEIAYYNTPMSELAWSGTSR